jgi:hypothetical protein
MDPQLTALLGQQEDSGNPMMRVIQMMMNQGQGGSPAGANMDPRLAAMQKMQPQPAPAPTGPMPTAEPPPQSVNQIPQTTEEELEDVHSQMDQDTGAPMLAQAQSDLEAALSNAEHDADDESELESIKEKLIDEFIQKYGEENLPENIEY